MSHTIRTITAIQDNLKILRDELEEHRDSLTPEQTKALDKAQLKLRQAYDALHMGRKPYTLIYFVKYQAMHEGNIDWTGVLAKNFLVKYLDPVTLEEAKRIAIQTPFAQFHPDSEWHNFPNHAWYGPPNQDESLGLGTYVSVQPGHTSFSPDPTPLTILGVNDNP